MACSGEAPRFLPSRLSCARLPADASIEGVALEVQFVMTGAWVMGATSNPPHQKEHYLRAELQVLRLAGAKSP